MTKPATKMQSSPMKSWQVFHFCRKHLGSSILYAIFGKQKARAIDYWAEDPMYTGKGEGAYDPLLGIKKMLNHLDDKGHCGVVRATIAFLCEGTSCDFDHKAEIVEPLPSLAEEILADYRAVSELQRGIEMQCDPAGVDQLLRDAIAELERTVAKYMENCHD